MDELTATERDLVRAVETGEVLDLTARQDTKVRAEVIRRILMGALAEAADRRGVRLTGAELVGPVDWSDVETALPLVLDSCVAEEPVTLDWSHLRRVRFVSCRLAGLSGDRMTVRDDLSLSGTRCVGGVCLRNADIGGTVDLSWTTIEGGAATALDADGLVVGAHLALGPGCRMTSSSGGDTVRLSAARVGGQFRLPGTTIDNTGTGSALAAHSMRVTASIQVTGLRATSASAEATLTLVGLRVDSAAFFRTSTIVNTEGPAVDLLGADIRANAFLGPKLDTAGAGGRATVVLASARIGSQLRVDGTRTRRSGGIDLDLANTQVGGQLVLPIDRTSRLVVDGLTYAGVPAPAPVEDWLALLRKGTLRYAAQPYQQLAAAHRAAGHERDARRILVAQQQDLLDRGDLGGWPRRLTHWLSGALIGYGYRSWRALGWLGLTVLLAAALTFGAGTVHVKDQPPGPCTVVEKIGYAVDLAVPLVRTGGSQRCEFDTTSAAGQWQLGLGWLCQLLGWAFATVFVAGFTGLVRRS